MSLDFVVQDRMGRWTFFWGGGGWCCGSARPPWDCGVAYKNKRSILLLRCVDVGLSSIPAVNSILDFLHCFSSVSFNGSHLRFLLLLLPLWVAWRSGTKMCNERHLLLPFPAPLLSPSFFIWLCSDSSPQGPSLCSSSSEGMQYCRPSA